MRLACGSAALTEVSRDGNAVNGRVQEKAVSDDPVPEMAARRTDKLRSIIIILF